MQTDMPDPSYRRLKSRAVKGRLRRRAGQRTILNCCFCRFPPVVFLSGHCGEGRVRPGERCCARRTGKAGEQGKRMKSVVVVGAQWGDEGKGKVVDYLSGSFDHIARVAG